MKKLNLGCGSLILEGYDNLDCIKLKGVNIVCDLQDIPYPIKSNSYDEIYARNILEHLNPRFDKILEEWFRILKIGGKLNIVVPYDTSYLAWGNFQHTRAFNLQTFLIFAKNTMFRTTNNDYGLPFRFKKLSQKVVFAKGLNVWNYPIEFLANKFQMIYETTGLRYWFPAKYLEIELVK